MTIRTNANCSFAVFNIFWHFSDDGEQRLRKLSTKLHLLAFLYPNCHKSGADRKKMPSEK